MNKNITVLWLTPAKKDSATYMLFAKWGIPYLEANGIKVITHNFYESRSIFGIFREIFAVRKIAKAHHVDFIHAQFGSTTALLALLTAIPFIITFRGTDLNGDPGSSAFLNFLRIGMGKLAAHFSKAIICVSSALLPKTGPAFTKSCVIPDGTKVEMFIPIPKSQAKTELGLSQQIYYIGFASGGRRKVKRFDLAESVKLELNRRGYQAEILEIWDIPHEKVPVYINASDVVILTSEREGSPNIVRESLACGVPVVSFDVGDAREWVELDKVSSIVPNRDVLLIANKVEGILKNPPSRERRIDVNLFSQESSAKKLLDVYKSLH